MTENLKGGDETFSPAQKMDGLSERQKEEVEHRSRPNAALIHETIRAEGESELERKPWALALSGLAAGLSMGFSLVAQGELHARLPAGAPRELIAPMGYTIGFLIVVLGRQQLFTENTLTPVLPVLHNRDRGTFMRMLRLWGIVLVTNMAGAWLFALTLAHGGMFGADVMASFATLGGETIQAGFGLTYLRAIFAGWLIATMVWLLPAADAARPTISFAITYVVALGGFSHIVAGAVDCAFLVLTDAASPRDFLTRFFLPTVLGNLCGGIALVAVLNYGQVAPEISEDA
jgi:formate/nitrite transporter FocA (FNT family)